MLRIHTHQLQPTERQHTGVPSTTITLPCVTYGLAKLALPGTLGCGAV